MSRLINSFTFNPFLSKLCKQKQRVFMHTYCAAVCILTYGLCRCKLPDISINAKKHWDRICNTKYALFFVCFFGVSFCIVSEFMIFYKGLSRTLEDTISF